MRNTIAKGVLVFGAAGALGLGCANGGTSNFGFVDVAADGGAGSTGAGGGSLFGDGDTATGTGVCSPNPANYDIPNNGCDDDANGVVDDAVVCDQALAQAGSAHDFANAIGLCQDATATKWGIVSVAYTQGYDSTAAPNDGQHGILASFGSVIRPREGARLGALSSGFAREWDDASGAAGTCAGGLGAPCFKGPQSPMTGGGSAPPGYPKAAAGCTNSSNVNDAIGVTLTLKVPANAQGLQFDFDFYSGEWPEYVCSNFNDSFVAWLQSTAYPGNPPGDLNISFDAKGNPVSVNNGFFDRCTPSAQTGCQGTGGGIAACAGGANELQNTGFYNLGTYCHTGISTGGGATGWLTTKAPVKQGETITLQFLVWDTGDANWDSSVLIDAFQWQPGPTVTGTNRPPQ